MPKPKKTRKRSKSNNANTSWLQVIESEPPKFFCPIINERLVEPCSVRGCLLWTSNRKVYSCAGAFGGMKAANAEERLKKSSAAQRERRGTLRSAAEGKLSFYDLAYLFSLSRQRVEGFVSHGRQISETLAPLLADIDVTGERTAKPASRRLGSPSLFTSSAPSWSQDADGEVTRVCICCESVIEPDDQEVVISIIDKEEVAWCSRECSREMPIDAYLIADRYKRHWTSVALSLDPVDERSRVREITTERMDALERLALDQGFKGKTECEKD